MRTPVELLDDAIQLATAGRTARWLDRLVDEDLLTRQQRAALAAEDGASTLSRLLRRVELAGRDPEQALRAAVAERDLDDARQLTNVLHHRIAGGRRFDPVGDSFAERVPRVDDPGWQRYLDTLAAAADERRVELGADLAEDPPQWAVEALGPPPAAGQERGVWERRAGTVAAHRELTGHDDDATALGAAPRPGQPEIYASWRAAWRALGRPDADLDERELSDGQLRLRVRAYEREKPWAPRYVANELAATRQAAERHRGTATLRAAEAAAADGPERTRLEREAADAAALATVLDDQAAQLELADQARARWLLHTAATRAEADRAAAELSARRAAIEDPEPEVTAEEWLAAHREAMRDDDEHREISAEHELVDEPAREPVAPPVEDVREVAAAEPPVADEDVVRVPTGDETAESIRRAQRALSEIQAREDADAARQREEQLVRWHVDDQVAEQHAAVDSDDRAPVMEIGGGR